MKILFIEAKYDKPIKLDKPIIAKLPSKVGLVSSIQFLDRLPYLKSLIEGKANLEKRRGGISEPFDSLPVIKKLLNKNKQIKKAIIGGQILGCDVKNAEKIKNSVDAFLYIGDGRFHPLGVALSTKKNVFTFNPLNNHFSKIKQEEIDAYERRKKAALVKFLHAQNVGVLVSTKPGQYYDIKKLNVLEKKYKDKKFYTFVSETIDYNQLENFPFIEAWVNTACPRIEEDFVLMNISEIIS